MQHSVQELYDSLMHVLKQDAAWLKQIPVESFKYFSGVK